MKKRTVAQVATIEKVDDNGEVISIDNAVTTFSYETEPEYVKLYLKDIGKLNGLSPASNNVLLELIRGMSYNNVIPVYMPIKRMIANKLGISVHAVEKGIKEFYKKGLFIRAARGVYIADPQLFGKGKWTDIKKLRLVIDYEKDGSKKLSSNIPEQLKLKLGL